MSSNSINFVFRQSGAMLIGILWSLWVFIISVGVLSDWFLLNFIDDSSISVKISKIRRIIMSKIKLNILKESKASESFRFSSLNTQKIIFAGYNKPRIQSKRIYL